MSSAKERWLKKQHENPKNWCKKTCPNCGVNFKVNYITQPIKDPELGWCNECYRKIIEQ